VALSEFRTKKMNHVFGLADLDGGGSITYKDFTLFRDKLEAQGAIPPKGTPKYERLQAELMATWNNMRELADTSRDEKVTRVEWLAWASKLNDEAEASGGAYPFESFMSSLIDVLDFDDDGYIGLGEYQAAAVAWSMKDIDVAANLKVYDTNGDGKLSREEVISILAEFYFGEDPSSPATNFYGRLP